MMRLGIDSPQDGMDQIRLILGLGPTKTPLDVVLVSFDLEGKPDSPKNHTDNQISQVGVSMLDTRGLSSSTPTGSLVTRSFAVGGNRRLIHTARRYHFGVSEHLDWDHVNDTIIDLFHIPDETQFGLQRKYRNIVLVGHGLRSDLLILRQRGILLEEMSTIVAKFDTSYLAKDTLGVNFGLQGLLNILQCPHKYLHNAGNDANFTLRALLLLTYYGLRSSVNSPEEFGS